MCQPTNVRFYETCGDFDDVAWAEPIRISAAKKGHVSSFETN